MEKTEDQSDYQMACFMDEASKLEPVLTFDQICLELGNTSEEI
ncbi:hypothetical protein [Faecalibaculum rodentium]|jgi:hypothetical protein|nr:hypothetical protein [Faecalibaculum rodentium]